MAPLIVIKSFVLVLSTLYISNSVSGKSTTEKSSSVANSKHDKFGKPIFVDDFNTFNTTTWSHEITAGGGGNGEFQFYQNNRSNSFVMGGKLYIKPTLTTDKYGENFLYNGVLNLHDGTPATQCTNAFNDGCIKTGLPTSIIPPIMSARIRTVNSFAFTYGRIIVRAKLPTGDWLWPAIWLLPRTNRYGGWPASGEIDIMESRGNKKFVRNDGVDIGVKQVGFTLHYGPYFPLNGFERAHFSKSSTEGFDKDFHDYEVEWTPDYIRYHVDGNEVGTVNVSRGGFWELGGWNNIKIDNPWKYAENPKMAPFDQEFFIVINLAVGGNNGYFPDNEAAVNDPPKPWTNSLSQGEAALQFWKAKQHWYPTWNNTAFVIDYVKVFPHESNVKVSSLTSSATNVARMILITNPTLNSVAIMGFTMMVFNCYS